ncbi:MAG: DUF222 domain-containing protein [Candidatus Nanopelagicales bacterium]
MAEFAPTPSPELSGLLRAARTADWQDVVEDTLDAVKALRRAEATQAVRLVALQEFSEQGHNSMQAATDEIGLLLGISSRSAEHLVGTALWITLRPTVWQGWYDGVIDRVQAQKIVMLLHDVADPLREELEAQAIDYAATHTTAQLHRRLIRMTCDEDPQDDPREKAIAARGAGIIPGAHGMCDIWIHTSAELGEAFIQGLDALAQAPDCPDPYGQGADRTDDQLRADALTGFLEAHTTMNVDVQVIIPADMLMGVETKGANLNGSPITHALAVKLAWSPDARWTRLVTDPLTGVLMDPGSQKYEIPKRLREAVRMRDRTCRFPGCTRDAEYTDTDHVTPHRISGSTCADDLICLCRHHHRTKTFGAWRITTTRRTHGAETTWTSPQGTTRTTRPPDLRLG